MLNAIELLLEREEEELDQGHSDGKDRPRCVESTSRNPSAEVQPRIRDGQELRNDTRKGDGLNNTVSRMTFRTIHEYLPTA
jgi:hypothetical protein